KSADGVIIPSAGVDYIVIAPNGAYPTSCYPLYPLDGLALMDYVEMCNAGHFEAYLEKFCADGVMKNGYIDSYHISMSNLIFVAMSLPCGCALY
ncbi:MAG TPA: hypothetical protein PLZ51_19830, partial [Aggregatilineales bacterium]|nr:hypothetical protein [Aggregatilineales bacterium]